MGVVLADRTVAMLGDLPPFLAGAKDTRGTLDAVARELDRVEAAKDTLRANFFATTASEFLSIYEAMLGLAIDPANKTLAQRSTSVQAFMAALASSGSGLDWQDQITRLIGTSWSHAEYDPANPASPAPNVVRLTLPFAAALSAPTGLTAVDGGVGALAAGTYFYAVTATNVYGETTASTAVSLTVAASRAVALDWADVTGATGYAVYRGASATTLTRIATVTVSAYTDPGGQAPGVPPPTDNSTESFQAGEVKQLARQVTPAHVDLAFNYGAGFIVGYSPVGEGTL